MNEFVCIQVFIPFFTPKWTSFVLYSGIPPVITGDFVFYQLIIKLHMIVLNDLYMYYYYALIYYTLMWSVL